MPVTVQTGGNKKESTLDKILKGIQVGGSVLDTINGVQKIRAGNRDSEKDALIIKKAQQDLRGMSHADIVKAGYIPSPLSAGPGEGIAGGPPGAAGVAEGPRFSKRPSQTLQYYDPETDQMVSGQFEKADTEKNLKAGESDLRDKWSAQPTTKRSIEMAEVYSRLKNSLDNPGEFGSADVLSTYMLMKFADPGSTVREGELAMASNAGGVDMRIRNFWNAVQKGQNLTPKLRTEFKEAAQNILRGQQKVQSVLDDQYKGLADQDGFKHENVILPLFKGLDAKMKKEGDGKGGERSPGGTTPPPTAPPKAGVVEDGHRFKGGDPADRNNWVKE